MYNVQANYNAYANNLGSYGMNGMYGMGMGYMSPMMNVGVGQFNADYLVKNDDRNNNYYTRPVAAHVHKDETPTILGILATALGTAALIAGLAKGRGRGFRGRANTAPVNPTPVNPNTGAVNPTPVNPTPAQNVITDSSRLLPPSSGKPAYTRKWNANTQQVVTPAKDNIIDNTNYNNLVKPGTVNNPQPANPQLAGLLPAHNQKYTNALKKQAEAMNLPSSGQTIVTPYNAASYTRQGMMTPEAQEAYNRILAQQFKPGVVREMRRADAREAFHPKNAVNEKLAEIRPELMREGKVVYTTHTQPSLSEGYSIGTNAKGADKLAELFKQMQG